MASNCRVDGCDWPATQNTDEFDDEGAFDGYCDDCRTIAIEDAMHEPVTWDRRPL